MNAIQQLITEHMDIWTAADTAKRSGRGRASGNAGSVYGVKKLRELILELAVRGKLVPQDGNDESASELLKRIQAEKAKLVAEGKIKKDKQLAAIAEDDKPFELPKNWEWVRLGQIAEANTGYAFKSSEYTNKGTFVLRVTNINPNGSLDLTDSKYIDPVAASSTYRNFLLNDGDILLVMVGGSLGKLGVVNKHCLPAVLNQNMWRMTRFGDIEKDFFLYGLRLINTSQVEITNSTHGHLAQGEYLSKLFPLPPLTEQHRIAAKVDELMALCDQLEAQHSNAAAAHEKLVSHLLGTLTQAQTADDFSANWQRITAHFDTLFTTESSIDALKQTLLQLAVMGKLVPQDPNDEPASELLKRIQAEKATLVAEGKIKKDKPLALIAEDEKPFELPIGWKWARLADLFALVTDGDHQAPPKAEFGVPFLVIGNLNTGNISLEDCRFVPDKYYEELDWGKKPSKNDLLYTVTGSYGIPVKVDIGDKFCVQRHVAILKSVESTPINYLGFLLKSQYALLYATDIATGIAQKTVPLTGLRLMPIASPPEDEQLRIVAKVDELMTLCDQLKTRITAANQQQLQLADVLVAQHLA